MAKLKNKPSIHRDLFVTNKLASKYCEFRFFMCSNFQKIWTCSIMAKIWS